MRKASTALLYRLARPKHINVTPPILSGSYVSDSNRHSSLLDSLSEHPKPCTKTNGQIFHSRRFQANPCRELDAQGRSQPEVSSRQRKIQERSQLDEAFEEAETTQEMLRIFKEMEGCFEERELGLAALKLGLKLDQDGEEYDKAFELGVRAFRALSTADGKPSLPVAMALQLAGSASYNLSKFNDALGFLNKAKRILGSLEKEDTGVTADDVRPILHAVMLGLANTKTAMGRREEALEDLRKCLEIKEMTLEEDSKQLGVANRELAEAYIAVLNFKDALPFGLKALEIHNCGLGSNSLEVAHDRRVLGIIYSGLEDHGKALEQNQLSQKILKKWGLGAELVQAEIDASNMQIALGKFDEAMNTLKGVVQQTEKDSDARALVFISIAKVLYEQEKWGEAKKCLQIASGILDKKENVSAADVAEAYSEIAMLYESMNEFETAISLLKRSLSLLERVPQEQPSEASISARVGWLLLMTGKVSQAIPFLESAAERLKESFGPRHYGVGYIYNNLGAAYLELERPQSAAQVFAMSKEILNVALGPHHADSIEACQNLSKAYAAMQSYQLAIEFQMQAIRGWESHGSDAEDELKEARRVLEELHVKARGGSASQLHGKALPLVDGNSSLY